MSPVSWERKTILTQGLRCTRGFATMATVRIPRRRIKMRMSKLFSKTLREAPNGADSKGYEYLLRAGFIRQLGAGIFSLLPFGFNATKKIEQVIREEMNAIGGQEILMPLVNPADIWKETGRYYSIDKEMSR